MADEQGFNDDSTGLADGEFSRKKQGRTVKGDITALSTLLANVGEDGRGFNQRSSPPSNSEVGDLYLSDGSGWNPNAAGVPDLVIYDTGGGWTSIVTL